MHARLLLIVATILSTSAFAAEPAKPAPQPPAHGDQPQANVVLASADKVRAPGTAAQQRPSQPKRRLARVTGCRCGDQEAQPDE